MKSIRDRPNRALRSETSPLKTDSAVHERFGGTSLLLNSFLQAAMAVVIAQRALCGATPTHEVSHR